jgi:hypothetical protein
MGHPPTPRTDALFGVFLQDIREIRQRHPKSFGNKYLRFDYTEKSEDGYCLFIKPDNIPKAVKREIMQAFDRRLNQDLLPVSRGSKRKLKEVNL